MKSIQGRIGWASLATFFSAATMAAGLTFSVPGQAAFELPQGEKITNVPAIPRSDSPKGSVRTLRSENRQKFRHQESSGYARISACGRKCGTTSASAVQMPGVQGTVLVT